MTTKIKIYFLVFLLIIAIVAWLNYQIYFPRESFCDNEILFSVSRGEGFMQIGDNLEEEGVIKNSIYFKIYALLSGKFNQFQAGSYLFCIDESIKNIVNAMYQGETAQKKITIIEGWNTKDIVEYLESLEISEKNNLLGKIESSKFDHLYYFLQEKPEESGLEGYLFPDTYLISYEADIDLIIEIILANFDNKLDNDLRKEIENQEKSIFEIITVASLIEKEVRSYEDKRLVSGIIWKRLEIGMPLQIDATVSYIINKKTTKISIIETQIDSPYNTYKYKGLPIGPICNPGLESIKAAIFPEESDYLFYLSKPDGQTVFNENLEKHNIAKNKYLK